MSAMAPDAIEIRRVYTRRAGEQAPDQLLNAADVNQLVVEWAAGSAANAALGAPASVTIEVITRNVTVSPNVNAPAPLTNTPGAATNTDGAPREGVYEFPIALPVVSLAPGTTYQTFVRIFAGSRISFAEWVFCA